MKKLLLILTVIIAAGFAARSQTTGGPDSYGYVWRNSNDPNGPVYNWIDIKNIPFSNQVKLLGDDNTVGPFQVGFPFHFYWYDDSVFYVGSNGYISFLNGQLSSPFPMIPMAGKLNNYIAGLTSDLNFGSTDTSVVNYGSCWYYTTPGNDSLIVTYDSVPYWSPNNTWSFSGPNSFQIIITSVDSSITIQYQLVSDSAYNLIVGYLSTGIESVAGSLGLQHLYDVYPQSNMAVKYYYPANTTYVVNDAATIWSDNPTTGGLFLSNNGGAKTLMASVRNQGNQTSNPFNVTANVVKKPSNQTQVTNTMSTTSLSPGQVQDFTFPNTWSPSSIGTYVLTTTTNLPIDIVSVNNKKDCEYVVVDTTTANQWLTFDDGIFNGIALSWLGGNGGAAMQFFPPYYPCSVNSLRFYIVSNTSTTGNPVGFSSLIYAGDGFNGAPITLLDSQFVDPNVVLPNSWNNVQLVNPLIIDSGSVYVVWYMGGDGIQLGTSVTAPFSNRSFEILGNTFAQYRDRESQDLLINMEISDPTVGLNENGNSLFVSEVYPNPAISYARLTYRFDNVERDFSYSIFSTEGKMIRKKNIGNAGNEGTVSLDISGLSNGIYFVKLENGKQTIVRRMSIVR